MRRGKEGGFATLPFVNQSVKEGSGLACRPNASSEWRPAGETTSWREMFEPSLLEGQGRV